MGWWLRFEMGLTYGMRMRFGMGLRFVTGLTFGMRLTLNFNEISWAEGTVGHLTLLRLFDI